MFVLIFLLFIVFNNLDEFLKIIIFFIKLFFFYFFVKYLNVVFFFILIIVFFKLFIKLILENF